MQGEILIFTDADDSTPLKRKAIFTLLFLVASIGIVLVSPPSPAAVGRTPGSFAVTQDGATAYNIPIWAPHGPNGLQPNIALTYNSRQSNGYVGVGWSVDGLSSIYRCNRTFAQDGAAAPVTPIDRRRLLHGR